MTTEKLDWDYSDRNNNQTATYRGYTLTARFDTHAEDPFANDGCHWPMAVYYDRNLAQDKVGAPMDAVFAEPKLLVTHQRLVAAALDAPHAMSLIRDHGLEDEDEDEDCKSEWTWDSDVLEEVVRAELDGYEGSDWIARVAAVLTAIDVPNHLATSRGYSQGDWADLLIVADAATAKKFGITDPEKIKESLAEQAKLYTQWAWGDVYGCTIEGPDGNDLDDSCWGFHGSAHHRSGLEEFGREAVDADIDRVRKLRGTKLKSLIRARVPLDLRPELLEAA